MRHRSLTMTLTVLLLAGCSQGEGEDRPSPTHTAESAATATAAPDAGPATGSAGDADGDAATATASGALVARTPVEWPDAPRELTEVEREFFFEPGPLAGDGDGEAAEQAVLAMGPTTEDEWVEAILAQTQGDYVEEIKKLISFDPSIGDAAAGPTESAGPSGEAEAVGTNHFAIVLDASGSMGERSGSGTRMEEAKAAIEDFVGQLPPEATVSVRVYGHEGDNTDAGKEESCASSEVLYDGVADQDDVASAITSLEPTGWTPLADGIELAGKDLPEEATDGIVYVVTDGRESCGGDPVRAAKALSETGIEPVVNVIGFQVGDADQEALRAIADAGRGTYTPVESGAELENYWREDHQAMMRAWNDWRNTELMRINREGSSKKIEVNNLGNSLKMKVNDELNRSLQLTNSLALGGKHMDTETADAVRERVQQRHQQMWDRVDELHNIGWDETDTNHSDAWEDVYDQGESKWTEYYEKSQAGD